MENAIDELGREAWPEPPEWLDLDDDPSGGCDDELTAAELSAMCDGSMDGPDPESHPEAYPQLRTDGDLRAVMAASVLDAAPASDLDDAALVGSMVQWRELASRAAAWELRATAELLRRRPAQPWDGRGRQPEQLVTRAAVQEIALGLTLTGYGAQTQADLADALARRLPQTFEAMQAGAVDRGKAAIIHEATSLLDDEAARQADAVIAGQAGNMTTGELRSKLRSAVIKIDPQAAEKRRRRAERRARVRLYGNPDHTATLAAENLPAAPAVAAFARVAAVAAAMKASGMKGGIEVLRSRALLGLLLGNLPQTPPGPPGPAGPAGPPDGPAGPPPEPPGQPGQGGGAPELYGWDQDPDDPDGDDEHDDGSEVPWPPVPPAADAASPGCAPLPAGLRPAASRMALTIPWRTLTGTGAAPGELCWIGPVTTSQAARIAAAAAIDPAARWNLIITDDDGRALTAAPLRSPAATGQTAPGLAGSVTVTIPASAAATAQSGQAAISLAAQGLDRAGAADVPGAPQLARLLAEVITAARKLLPALRTATDGCSHSAASAGYVVPGKLRRQVAIRDRTCRDPICRQPAARTDQDHTRAYQKGGMTCECNLGCLCRLHHQLKQLPGWTLTQIRPGYFTWTTPAGLTYDQAPDPYPV